MSPPRLPEPDTHSVAYSNESSNAREAGVNPRPIPPARTAPAEATQIGDSVRAHGPGGRLIYVGAGRPRRRRENVTPPPNVIREAAYSESPSPPRVRFSQSPSCWPTSATDEPAALIASPIRSA
jgi:hypothetical protein